MLRSGYCCRTDSLHRRKTCFDQQGKFAGIVTVTRYAAIGSESDHHTAIMRPARHFDHVGANFQGFPAYFRRHPVGIGGNFGHRCPGEQGGDQIDIMTAEQADGFVVQIGAVFDGVNAVPDR